MKFDYKIYHYSPTDEEIIADLQKVLTDFNLSKLTMHEYDKYGKYNSSTVSKRFGSWNVALLKAGLGVVQQFWDEEQLFKNLAAVWIKKGTQPRRRDMDNKELSFISSGAYLRKFGQWSNALKKFVVYMNQDDTSTDESGINDSSCAPSCHHTKRDINLRLRFKVLQRDNFKCCSCGASPAKDPSVELHVDHVIPWAKGGETVLENLQTLCSKCNLGKSDLL